MQKNIILFGAVCALIGVQLRAADFDETPDSTPVSVSPCTPSTSMSLDLYRSLREKALQLSESQSSVAESADKPAINPGQVLGQLAAEVRENEVQILQALCSPKSIQRELAARVLSLANDKKAAIAALSSALKGDTDEDVRTTSAFTLGRIGDAAAVDALIQGLSDSKDAVRIQCAAALGRIRDERAVPELMQLLRADLRPLLRIQAASALGQIKTGVNDTDLTSALENEGDERVKMAIASAIRAVTGSTGPEAEIPEQGDYSKQLTDLSAAMKGVEQKLRDDRFDEVVQVDQNDIDEKLGDMIRQLEKMQSMQIEKREKDSRKEESRRRLAMMMGEQPSSTPTRNPAKQPSPVDSREARINAGKVIGRNENWASLPQAERDELLQVFRPEVPLRWRKRLEAYFISLAAEEAKAEQK